MQLTLNIYEAGQVSKTYTANEFDLMFGTIEDLVDLIDLDAFNGKANDTEFISAAAKVVVGGFDNVKDLLKEIFPGLTDEELRKVKIKEVIPLLVQIIKYSLSEIAEIGKGKN